jgi:hypothetical protein
MQHAMVGDGNANASRGEPQDKMMAAQHDAEIMTLLMALATRLLSGLGGGIGVVTSTHGVIYFDAGQAQQACAAIKACPLK